jgi:hypothetical protein
MNCEGPFLQSTVLLKALLTPESVVEPRLIFALRNTIKTANTPSFLFFHLQLVNVIFCHP